MCSLREIPEPQSPNRQDELQVRTPRIKHKLPYQIKGSPNSCISIILRNAHNQHSRGVNSHSVSNPPPFSVHYTDPSKQPGQHAPDNITDNFFSFSEDMTLKIAQLNCFNRQSIIESLLTEDTFDILILQEPWVNPHTLQIPSHPAWHELMAYDYTASNFGEKTRTCIYVSKRTPSWNIALLPSGSQFVTALELKNIEAGLPVLRILSVYNPPTHNTGLPVLETWLKNHNDRKIPTIIGMDANLHHPKWNPVTY